MRLKIFLLSCFVLVSFSVRSAASRPIILWSKEEAVELRQRIETDPQAKAQFERMLAKTRDGKSGHPTLMNLFKYAVLGDEQAGQAELRNLLGFQNKVPEPMTEAFKVASQGRKWTRGGPSFSDRHMRDEQTLNVLRYDVLYDRLTDEQRTGIENSFKAYIQFHIEGHRPWHPDFRYDRMSWLPNMHWPRAIGTHLMAVALQDEQLIRAMFESTGGWKWYFDEYIADGRFYCEEFGKYYSNIGTMLLYCEGLERLKLGQYGYGYSGKGGATMLNYLKMYFELGYPRIDIPEGRAAYMMVEMGDTPGKGLPGLNDDKIIKGSSDFKKVDDNWFNSSQMNGPLPKFMLPLWYEIGHRRFPSEHFDYFLAQLRDVGEDIYLPSLFFGLKPIKATEVKPPPVRSYVAMERGFAMLRADQSPAYWEGNKPAVSLQFGMYYVHYAHDSFSILGYYAFNRALYVHAWGGSGGTVSRSIDEHRRGYTGGHPWHDTVRGNTGVVVDNLKAMPIASGNNGLDNHIVREEHKPHVKFAAGRVAQTTITDTHWVFNEAKDEMETVTKEVFRGIYPGVDLERALFLTDEYMFDLYWLKSDKPRQYDWHVLAVGNHYPLSGQQWTPTSELNGSMLYREYGEPQPAGYKNNRDGNDLIAVHKMNGNDQWSIAVLQDHPRHKNASKSVFPKQWYEKGVGVRISMLSEDGSTVFVGRPPIGSTGQYAGGEIDFPEPGGTALMVRRVKPQTVFVALHEPFQGGMEKLPDTKFSCSARNDTALVVKISNEHNKLNDRVLLAYGDGAKENVELKGEVESYHFNSHGFIRITEKQVIVTGQILSFNLPVAGKPRLTVNDKVAKAEIRNGIMSYDSSK